MNGKILFGVFASCLALVAMPNQAQACSVKVVGPTEGVTIYKQCNAQGYLTMANIINRSKNTYRVTSNIPTMETLGIASGTNHVLPSGYNDGSNQTRLYPENPRSWLELKMEILPTPST